jgi:hypothetical protein
MPASSHPRGCRAGHRQHPVCSDRPRDILERLLALIFEGEIEAARRILLNARRNADATRFGQGLKPCRDIHPVAEDVAVLDHYVALVNADAKFDLSVCRAASFVFGHTRLDFHRTSQSVDDAAKLDKQAIAGGLHYPALMLSDLGVDYFTPVRLQPGKGPFLVGTH